MRKAILLVTLLSVISCSGRTAKQEFGLISFPDSVVIKHSHFVHVVPIHHQHNRVRFRIWIPMYKRVPMIWLEYLAAGKRNDPKGS